MIEFPFQMITICIWALNLLFSILLIKVISMSKKRSFSEILADLVCIIFLFGGLPLWILLGLFFLIWDFLEN